MNKCSTSYAFNTVSNIIDTWLSTTTGGNNAGGVYYYHTDFQTTAPSYYFPVTKKDYPDYPICNHYVDTDNGMNVIQIAVTGFDKKDLTVEIKDNLLIIKGKGTDKWYSDNWKEVYHGIPRRDFEIRFEIPEKFDGEKVKSECDRGILTIHVPMKDEILKKNRTIEIE